MKLTYKKDNGTILVKEFNDADAKIAILNGWKENKPKPKKKVKAKKKK